MNDDKLLHELGKLAEEENEESYRHFDERWDRLAAGTLTAGEEAELRAEAEASSEGRAAWEAFRPLDADFKSRVLESLDQERRAEDDQEAAPARTGKLLRFPTRRMLRYGAGLTVAASAAAAVLLMMRAPGELPPMPGYELRIDGGRQAVRSDPPAAVFPEFAAGDRFELLLRPSTAVEGPVAARLFLVSDGTPRPWKVELEVAAGGSLRLAGELGRELAIEAGDWSLWAAVGRPGVLPDAAEVSAGPGGEDGRDWVLLEARFRVLPAP